MIFKDSEFLIVYGYPIIALLFIEEQPDHYPDPNINGMTFDAREPAREPLPVFTLPEVAYEPGIQSFGRHS